jgi:hypothetical protein
VFDLSDIVCDWRTHGTPDESDLADFRKLLGIPSHRGLDSSSVVQPYPVGANILNVPGYGGSGNLAMTGITSNAHPVDDKDIGANVFLNLAAADTADDLAIRSTSNDHKVTDAIAPFFPAQPSNAECDGGSEVRIRRHPAFSNFRLDDKPGNPITMCADEVLMSTDAQHKVLPGAVNPVEMDNAVHRIEFGMDEPLTVLQNQSGRLSPAPCSVGELIDYSGNSMLCPMGTSPVANEAMQTTRSRPTALKDSPTMTAKATLAGNQTSQMIPDLRDELRGVSAIDTVDLGTSLDISNVDLKGQVARFLSSQKRRGSISIPSGKCSIIRDIGAFQANGAVADSHMHTDTALTTLRVLQTGKAPVLGLPIEDCQKRAVLVMTAVAKDRLQRVQAAQDTPSATKDVAALPATRRASRRTWRPASAIGGTVGMPEQELELILKKRRERKAALREARLDDEAVDHSEGKDKCGQNSMKTPRRVYGVKHGGTCTKDRSALEQATKDGYLAPRHYSTGEANIAGDEGAEGGVQRDNEKCEKTVSTVVGRSGDSQ